MLRSIMKLVPLKTDFRILKTDTLTDFGHRKKGRLNQT